MGKFNYTEVKMGHLIKLNRYPHIVPVACPFCFVNASLGRTQYGILGCQFCQGKVDDYIKARFSFPTLVSEGKPVRIT